MRRPHELTVQPSTHEGVEESAPDDFEGFYRAEYRRVVGVVLAMSGSRVGAEELAQEAFLRAHRDWDELAAHPNRIAWIRRVAINLALSRARRRTTEAKVVLRLSQERPRVAEMPEAAADVWAAVRRLPRNQAAAIVLRYHDDLAIDDIAEVLRCKPATVRVHLHRGRETLARELGSQADPGVNHETR